MAKGISVEQFAGYQPRFSPQLAEDLVFLLHAKMTTLYSNPIDGVQQTEKFFSIYNRNPFLRDKVLEELVGQPWELEMNLKKTVLSRIVQAGGTMEAKQTWSAWHDRVLQQAPTIFGQDRWNAYMRVKQSARGPRNAA